MAIYRVRLEITEEMRYGVRDKATRAIAVSEMTDKDIVKALDTVTRTISSIRIAFATITPATDTDSDPDDDFEDDETDG